MRDSKSGTMGKLSGRIKAFAVRLPLEDVVFLDLQPGGNNLLFRVNHIDGPCGLYVHYRTQQPVTATLPEKIGDKTLRDRLKSAASGSAHLGPEFLRINWPSAVQHGNAERGRRLFGIDGIGCANAMRSIAARPPSADRASRERQPASRSPTWSSRSLSRAVPFHPFFGRRCSCFATARHCPDWC